MVLQSKTTPQLPKLGIIAGGGGLPFELVKLARLRSQAYVVAAINGFADQQLVQQPEDFFIDFGKVGTLINKFKSLGVEDLILGGYVKKPSLRQLKPDRVAALFLAKVSLKSLGDNSLLEAVKSELSAHGFRVVGIDSLTTGLFVEEGPIGDVKLPTDQLTNLSLAISAAKELGAADKGQAVLVAEGKVVALEGPDGTDAMMRSLMASKGHLTDGMLLKAVKPQQDRSLDLPAVGFTTIELASQLGLKVVAVEANGGLVLQKEECIKLADSTGVCLYGFRDPHDPKN